MRNIIIVVVVLALLAFGAFFFINRSSDESRQSQTSTSTSETSNSSTNTESSTPDQTGVSSTVTIAYTDNGFSPSSSKLAKGGTVTWANNTNREVQIGVDPHPSHSGNKAITNGEFVISLSKGESRSVTVNETGTFGFHNHLDSGDSGSLTVE